MRISSGKLVAPVALLMLFMGMAPAPAEALVMRGGQDLVSVPEDKVVPGDFYAAGGKVNIAGTVEGDVYVLGGTVNISGTVEGDVVALGGTVSIHGQVNDDVRAFGGDVTIEKDVAGDVVSGGGSLLLDSGAHVGGDLFYFGGQADIEGSVAGVIYARGKSLTVNGAVHNIDASLGGLLSLGDSANVAGDIVYQSESELARAQNATVSGQISRTPVIADSAAPARSGIVFMLMTLFLALLSVLLLRAPIERLFARNVESIGIAGFAGLGVFFLLPAAIVLLIVSVLGVLAGAFLLFSYVALVLASGALMGLFIGTMIWRAARKSFRVDWLTAIIGVAAVEIMTFIPIIGPIVIFASFLIVLGMLSRELYFWVRSV